jgi:hypothetical protein
MEPLQGSIEVTWAYFVSPFSQAPHSQPSPDSASQGWHTLGDFPEALQSQGVHRPAEKRGLIDWLAIKVGLSAPS